MAHKPDPFPEELALATPDNMATMVRLLANVLSDALRSKAGYLDCSAESLLRLALDAEPELVPKPVRRQIGGFLRSLFTDPALGL